MNPKILKRFKKDYLLPIPIYDSKYFNYYLNLLDEHFDTQAKFNKFLEVYNESFLDQSEQLQQRIINDIKNSSFYQKFITYPFPDVQLNLTKSSLYLPENNSKKYVW